MPNTATQAKRTAAVPRLPGDISGEYSTAADRELFQQELADFLPTGLFDIHAHCYRMADLTGTDHGGDQRGQPEYGIGTAFERMSAWMGEHTPRQGLFFPFPHVQADRVAANAFLVGELRRHPDSRGLLLVAPEDTVASLQTLLREPGVSGFKTYHVYAGTDSFNQPVGAWTPEWVWEVAAERGWVIMLHLVLPTALSAPDNQRYLLEHCARYPRAQVVLAHAARGFNPRHTVDGIEALRGLPNVHFDTSAVTEAAAFEAILDVFGPGRLLYGSDFPVSEMRGRSIALGKGFYWLYEQGISTEWPHGKAVQVGLESLIALKQACRGQCLNPRDVERIFHVNAKELLGLPVGDFWSDVQQQYQHARERIPGGTQLLSKRPEIFAPGQWPAYYEEARGCEVVDTAGRRYIDMSTGGILACILGYADPDANAAVLRRVRMGSMSTLQTHDEVELADELCAIHPWASKVRFTRCGGESMAVAVRIARAATGRGKVAVCGYHGWHDWYLAANLGDGGGALDGHLLPGLEPGGVPPELAGTTYAFAYNDRGALDRAIARADGQLAAIVMETTRSVDPDPGFLAYVRQRADAMGAVLIFDEISIGWRLCLGGAHLKYGVNPDIAVFAKTISNGYAMGAVLGHAGVMDAAQSSFISSAYWTEGVGPAAALATVRKLKRLDVPAHLRLIGQQVAEGWRACGARHGLPTTTAGRPELLKLGFDHDRGDALLTFVTSRMLAEGFLAGAMFNGMWSHRETHVEQYLTALDRVFARLAQSLAGNTLGQDIGGPVKHSGFKRLAD